jgi:murein DD-endopeptidase MepM/ murein hydrolase activator NlpD
VLEEAMPDQTLMAALIAAALGGAEPELPAPPPFTRYPDEAYPIVSQFGSWKGIGGGRRGAPNEGVDIIARVRTPVHAAAYGVVRRVAVERERGRVVEIETTGTQPDYVMIYTHLHASTVVPCPASAPMRQIGHIEQGRVSGSS